MTTDNSNDIFQGHQTDEKKIFNLKQIEGACIIASPIVAGFLIYRNYKNFGETQKGVLWIFIGILWTAALIGLAALMPDIAVDKLGWIVPGLNGLILYPIITKLQGEKIKEHFANNGKKGSNWLVAGLTILFVAMFMIPIIWLNKVSPINNYTRQAFNENGVYYNRQMPLDEVNKLGGILLRIEYFNPEFPSEAVFIANDSTYEFKLIMEKKFLKDPEILMEIKEICKHVGRYDFQKPLTYMITDPYLADNQKVFLDNYDSIATLLEIIIFNKNPNLKLIYDMSIEPKELERVQRVILNVDNPFAHQNDVDFVMGLDEDTYSLRLFVPKQKWNDSQLLYEARIFRNSLNNGAFSYPFKLIFVDNSLMEYEEYEIE